MKNFSLWVVFAVSAISLRAQCIGLVSTSQSAMTIRNTRHDLKITAIAILEESNSHAARLQTLDSLTGNDQMAEWAPSAAKEFVVTPDADLHCAVMYENGITEGDEDLASTLRGMRRSELEALPDLEHLIERLGRNATSAADYRSGLIQYRNKNSARNAKSQLGINLLVNELLNNLNNNASNDLAPGLLETLHSLDLQLRKTI